MKDDGAARTRRTTSGCRAPAPAGDPFREPEGEPMTAKADKPLRGEAAWKAAREEIAKKNAAATERARKERAVRDARVTAQRREEERLDRASARRRHAG